MPFKHPPRARNLTIFPQILIILQGKDCQFCFSGGVLRLKMCPSSSRFQASLVALVTAQDLPGSKRPQLPGHFIQFM